MKELKQDLQKVGEIEKGDGYKVDYYMTTEGLNKIRRTRERYIKRKEDAERATK